MKSSSGMIAELLRPAQANIEPSFLSAASTIPLKMDSLLSAAAGLSGNLRGNDSPPGNFRERNANLGIPAEAQVRHGICMEAIVQGCWGQLVRSVRHLAQTALRQWKGIVAKAIVYRGRNFHHNVYFCDQLCLA